VRMSSDSKFGLVSANAWKRRLARTWMSTTFSAAMVYVRWQF
jgi:hypothetical protein